MADKTIGMLENVPSLHDESLLPVEQSGELMNVTGKQFREFAEGAAERYVDSATNAAERAESARKDAQSALTGVQTAIKNIPAGSTPIVNDLTTGGVTLALSAEQGKKLNSGKVSKSGDTMTGQLTARQRLYAEFPDAIKAGVEAHSSGAVDLQRLTLDGKYSAIRLYDDKGTGAQPVFCGNDTGAWYQYPLYHTGNKPTAADVGAMKFYGSFAEIGLTEATATAESITNAMINGSMLMVGCSTAGVTSGFLPVAHGLLVAERRNQNFTSFEYRTGSWLWRGYYNAANGNGIYWSGWAKIATTDMALMRDGSNAMTGNLVIEKNTPITRWRDIANNNEVTIYAANHRAYLQSQNVIGNDKNRRYLQLLDSEANSNISGALLLIDVVDGNTKPAYNILHTGNKPSGSYTGNGDAASRTITTGGIGRVVEVFRNGYAAILFQGGAIILQYSGNTASVSAIPSASVWTSEGSFAMKTTHAALNENGVTYYYQVL